MGEREWGNERSEWGNVNATSDQFNARQWGNVNATSDQFNARHREPASFGPLVMVVMMKSITSA